MEFECFFFLGIRRVKWLFNVRGKPFSILNIFGNKTAKPYNKSKFTFSHVVVTNRRRHRHRMGMMMYETTFFFSSCLPIFEWLWLPLKYYIILAVEVDRRSEIEARTWTANIFFSLSLDETTVNNQLIRFYWRKKNTHHRRP